MPWVPTTDFEEEIVNLQPNHDFIYGALSEAEYTYPRPKAHIEYAAKKKIENKKQRKQYQETGKINGSLRAIQQVQLMTGTKSVGEQACIDDWESNENVEKETIGMMRFCGLGASIEQPLNKKVTLASFPIDNTVKMVKNGTRRSVLYLNSDVFKFRENVSDIASNVEFGKNDQFYKDIKNDTLVPNSEDSSSFSTSSSISPSRKFKSINRKEDISLQYKKLVEDTDYLSLDENVTFSTKLSDVKSGDDSFKTGEGAVFWKPNFEIEDIFNKQENWPNLTNDTHNNNLQNRSSTNLTSDSSSSTDSFKKTEKRNFLNRFIKSESKDNVLHNSNPTSIKCSQGPLTYATIAKTSSVNSKPSLNANKKRHTPSNTFIEFPTNFRKKT